MGRFKGLGGVKISQGGLYFQPGNYLVEIDEVKMVETRKGDAFIIVATVVESDNDRRAPGCKPSQVLHFSKDATMGNIKQFAGAILGIENPDKYEPEDGQDVGAFWEESLEFLVSDENPMQGTHIKLTCTNIKVGKDLPADQKRDFTKHVWGPLKEAA